MGVEHERHAKDGWPLIPFESSAAFETWLDEHHEDTPGVWIKVAKKASGIASVDHQGALDVALCFGWIDGQARSYDDTYYLQRFLPRRPRSTWSKVNIDKVAALEEAGRMRPGGRAEVERAKADGRWAAAYDPPSRIEVPPDLQEFLDSDPEASAFFESLNSTNRFAILHRLQTAKRADTRARRLAEYTRMLAAGEKIYP